MAWESISDPTNPFNKTGLSQEVRSMLLYLEEAKVATGVDVVVTSTTDHPVKAASGHPSRHRLAGTNGEGLAIDCRLRTRGYDIHRPVFELFRPVALRCHELICANAPRNVRNEAWVEPYAVRDHRDHVHCAVDRGIFLRWSSPTGIPPTYRPITFPVYRWIDEEGAPMATERVRVELDDQGRGNELTTYDAPLLVAMEVWAPVRPNVDGYYPGAPGRVKPEVWPFEDGGKLGVIVTGGVPSSAQNPTWLDVNVTTRA